MNEPNFDEIISRDLEDRSFGHGRDIIIPSTSNLNNFNAFKNFITRGFGKSR